MSEAIVIGAGPGGITMAMALRLAGIDCTVYERDPHPDTGEGHLISLGTNGINALRAIGADVSGIPIPWLLAYSGSGHLLGELYNGPADRSATPGILVGRLEYRRQLYDAAVERGVRFVHGKTLDSYTDDGRRVTAAFDDGTRAVGDVLIGADGVHSKTRRTMFRNAPDAVYTGMLGLGGRAYTPRLKPTPLATVCLFGWEAFFSYHVEDDHSAHWMTFAPWPRPPHPGEESVLTDEEWKKWLRKLFRRDMSPIREVLDRSHGPVDVYPVFDVRGTPSWHSGRVALIGDAARTAPPRIGVGASLAMEDAVVVAKCLRDIKDPPRAFAAYEEQRQQRVRRVTRWGRLYARPPKVNSAAGMWLREVAMPPLLRLAPSISSMDWIYGYQVAWEEPALQGRGR
ncbi:FAD-dependent oxidoreductase [Streptomyces boncukensis]|uniref:NAD(P)-binding protein n=1 Tax=Streptomyces boncukensis TaxID=2711219 RepID=A0A6G4WPP7_9ACTN|nr:FAD-dependent monooxygenase [Streptomyces boncukensis]NGO67239.1 NAD(P)-binding protein [Streptomyces boncukensis]